MYTVRLLKSGDMPMLLQNSSDLIERQQRTRLANGDVVDLAWLINGQVLAVSANALALYSRAEAVHDELGNGLLASVAIPAELSLSLQDGGYIQEHRAGYVGLSDQRVLLITLNDVQLFASKQDALRNQNERARLPLAAG
ncbi:hypothetical protein CHH28_08090 [Bacterioplanes sanyensis]|uniref:Uncharacterized protein n=1 Tax=Bacterioplanes sanyensis TaxID=1249553 RepID=A0A222FIR1_9GAMM|nr:hypothetical protein [Bacterioplanes sanyensis]ASP38639.1 hypothetical protein CHH28_08090 [Bacterioplanes sanyensis]